MKMRRMRRERGSALGCGGCLDFLWGAMSKTMESGRTAKGEGAED